MITLTLWSSNELRIDHKLVNAESQTQFDFNAKTNEKNERTLTEGPRKIWFRFFSQVGSIYFHLESINQISNCGFWSEMDGVYIGFLEPLRSFLENWALIWTLHVCPWFSKTMGAPNMDYVHWIPAHGFAKPWVKTITLQNGLGSLNLPEISKMVPTLVKLDFFLALLSPVNPISRI